MNGKHRNKHCNRISCFAIFSLFYIFFSRHFYGPPLRPLSLWALIIQLAAVVTILFYHLAHYS